MKPRPQVAVFAQAMEAILETKDHRGRYLDQVDPISTLNRLFEAALELDREAYGQLHKTIIDSKALDKIQRKAVDVANFCAMIWWVCEAIRGAKSQYQDLFGRKHEE